MNPLIIFIFFISIGIYRKYKELGSNYMHKFIKNMPKRNNVINVIRLHVIKTFPLEKTNDKDYGKP